MAFLAGNDFAMDWSNRNSLYPAENHYAFQNIEVVTKWPPFSDDIFKCIFLNEKIHISFKIGSVCVCGRGEGGLWWNKIQTT